MVNLLFIPKIMERFAEMNINYTIHVKEGNASFILDALRNHEIDIGIVRSVFKHEDIQSIELFSEPLMLAVPPNHKFLDYNRPIYIKDLKQEKFLLQSTSFGYNVSEMVLEESQKYEFYPEIIYWGTEVLPILNMVQKGIGIAFVPKSYQKLENLILPRMLEISTPLMKTKLSLVTYKNRMKKTSTDIFSEVLSEVIKEMEV